MPGWEDVIAGVLLDDGYRTWQVNTPNNKVATIEDIKKILGESNIL